MQSVSPPPARPQPAAAVDSPRTWQVPAAIAGGAGLALAALADLLFVAPHLKFQYHPYGGVVGLPALLDYPAAQEIFYYGAAVVLATAGGWLGMWIATRHRKPWVGPALFALSLCALGWALVDNPTAVATLLKSIARDPRARLVLAGAAGLALPLLLPPRGGPPPVRDPAAPPPPAIVRGIALLGPCYLQIAIIFVATLPTWFIGVTLALPFACALAWVQATPWKLRRATHLSVWVERGSWLVLALAPLGMWFVRRRLTLGHPLPPAGWLAGAGVAVVMLPILAGLWRRYFRLRPAALPAVLLPFSVLALLTLATGIVVDYDGFHQGEFLYPARALMAGLTPWREIFYVHGFGNDTLLGVLYGNPWLADYGVLAALGSCGGGLAAAVATAWMLRMWGERWWLLAAVVGAFGVGAAAGPAQRYLMAWLAGACLLGYLRGGPLRWVTLAGACAAIGGFHSLDVGSALTVTLLLWSIAWGLSAPRGTLRSGPLLALLIGLAAVTLPVFIWMALQGWLGDFVSLHFEYLRMKRHYDKIPLALGTLSLVYPPAIAVAGLWVAGAALCGRERSPLVGCILFLSLFTLLMFLRAFDRADYGHVIFGGLAAWPLLGSIVVWLARPGRTAADAWSTPLLRSVLAGGLLLLLPHAPPLIGAPAGHDALVYPVGPVLRNLAQFVRAPFNVPPRDAESAAFFEVAGALRERLEPGERFYDFSNQPAIYPWTGRLAPTRFFTPFYAASEEWQDETIADLERGPIRLVLWRGPSLFWNAPDAIPNPLRQWKIASYLIDHYRPVEALAGGSLLLARSDAASDGAQAEFEELWLPPPLPRESIDLGWLPRLWGRGGDGVPEAPERIVARTKSRPASDSLRLALSPGSPPATELWLWIEPSTDGEALLYIHGVDGSRRGPPLRFALDRAHDGAYRIMLGNIPAWRWSGPIAACSLRFSWPLPDPTLVTAEFRMR